MGLDFGFVWWFWGWGGGRGGGRGGGVKGAYGCFMFGYVTLEIVHDG